MNGAPYSEFSHEKLILRDHLAIDRTRLANERTYLAYIRTALTLLIGGIGLMKFFEDDTSMTVVGTAFIALSVIIFIIGIYRFVKNRRHILEIVK